MPLRKLRVVCIRNISTTKRNPAKKNSEQCFSGETEPTCQNSGPFANIFFHTFSLSYNNNNHNNNDNNTNHNNNDTITIIIIIINYIKGNTEQ